MARMIRLAALSLVATALCLLLGTPHADATIYLDDFETSVSPQQRGWFTSADSLCSFGQWQSVTTHRFAGLRSLYIDNGCMVIFGLAGFERSTVARISIMYYDAMQTTPNADAGAGLAFSAGNTIDPCDIASLGVRNTTATYWVRLCGSEFATTVPRSLGWRRFEFRFIGSSKLALYIDGVQVGSDTLTRERLLRFQLFTQV
jgi:hypothetical protein